MLGIYQVGLELKHYGMKPSHRGAVICNIYLVAHFLNGGLMLKFPIDIVVYAAQHNEACTAIHYN